MLCFKSDLISIAEGFKAGMIRHVSVGVSVRIKISSKMLQTKRKLYVLIQFKDSKN